MSEYVRAAALSDLELGSIHRFLVGDGVRILVRSQGGVHALDGICTHQHAELAEAELEDGVLWCALHGAGFNVETGVPVCPPADQPLRRYDVRIDGDDVLVARDPLPLPE